MKKHLGLLTLILAGSITMTFVSSCGSAKQLKQEKETLQKSLSDCQSQKNALQTETTTLNAEVNKLNAQSKQLKDENATLYKDLNHARAETAAIKKVVDENNARLARIKKELQEAFTAFDRENVKIEERDGKLYLIMRNQVLYKPGKAALDTKGMEIVRSLSDIFVRYPNLNILVEGHTDDVPIKNRKYDDNWDLSVARATGVVRNLVRYGMDPVRVTAAGRGQYLPAATGKSSSDRAKNRRTEFVITPKTQSLYKVLNEL